jgi:CO/xanthine dehydrogenase FAD-binding subunit
MADHRFSGHDAFSADRTVVLLARQHPPAKPLAGDQGLYARMTLLLARPGAMTGLADPAGLSYIRITGGELRIGRSPGTPTCLPRRWPASISPYSATSGGLLPAGS